MKSLILVLGMLLTVNANATDVEALFWKFDENCSGNDSSGMREYDVEKLNLKKAQKDAVKSDSDAMGVDCRDGRAYPKKLKTIVQAFKERMEDTCVQEFTKQEYAQLLGLLTDKSNVAVTASLYAGNDNPEACDYDRYFIYRADGVLLDLTFNETD